MIIADTIRGESRFTSFLVSIPIDYVSYFAGFELQVSHVKNVDLYDSVLPPKEKAEKQRDDIFIPNWSMYNSFISKSSSNTRLTDEWYGCYSAMEHYIIGLNVYGASKKLVNRLRLPFEKKNYLISGSNWKSFFDVYSVRYLIDGKTYRNKTQANFSSGEDTSDWKTDDWDIININNNVNSEFQKWCSNLEDLYCILSPYKNTYHIPFKEYIDELFRSAVKTELPICSNNIKKLSFNLCFIDKWI